MFEIGNITEITTTTVMGMPRTLPNFESHLKLEVQSQLTQPYLWAVITPNAVRNKNQAFAAFSSYANGLLGTFPHLNDGNAKSSAQLIYDYFMILWNELSAILLDPTGARDAGVVTDHLGGVPFVNGSLDLSAFPLKVIPPTPPSDTPLDSAYGAPPAVYLSPQAKSQPGIFAPLLGAGVVYLGGPFTMYPNEPVGWQEWAKAHGVTF